MCLSSALIVALSALPFVAHAIPQAPLSGLFLPECFMTDVGGGRAGFMLTLVGFEKPQDATLIPLIKDCGVDQWGYLDEGWFKILLKTWKYNGKVLVGSVEVKKFNEAECLVSSLATAGGIDQDTIGQKLEACYDAKEGSNERKMIIRALANMDPPKQGNEEPGTGTGSG